MNKVIPTVVVVALITMGGCSALLGPEQPDVDDGVDVEDNGTGAEDVRQSVGSEVDETTAGEEWTEIGATYPRDRFTVDEAQHDQIELGVDTDGDGESERTFNETHVSGVNNNAYSFTVTLDTGYTLESGDVVVVEYPAIDNPSEPGEYTVEVRLNDHQTTNVTVAIE